MQEFKDQKEFDEYLFAEYPRLYRDMHAPMTETCMCWGACVGRGWWDIIDNMSDDLEAVIAQMPEEQQPTVKMVQLKEKFGGLRAYMSIHSEEIEYIIRRAENRCSATCEACGQPGEMRNDRGWYSVQCRACFSECEVKLLRGQLDWAKRAIIEPVSEKDCFFEKKDGCNPFEAACPPCAAKRWLEHINRYDPKQED